MVIDNATLLQVDTTAIVGIFIFLTLEQLANARRPWMVVTAILVIPFAVSTMLILIDETWFTGNGELSHASRVLAIGGFGYILFIFGYVLLRFGSQKPQEQKQDNDKGNNTG